MPSLTHWLSIFALPSLVANIATFIALYWTQRSALAIDSVEPATPAALGSSAKLTGIALSATAFIMLGSSAMGWERGLPTFTAAVLSTVAILAVERKGPVSLIKNISWGVLPLVAGLFVIVEALERAGLVEWLATALSKIDAGYPSFGPVAAGTVVALASNAVNNLPAGLVAGGVVHAAHAGHTMAGAILIGVDQGKEPRHV